MGACTTVIRESREEVNKEHASEARLCKKEKLRRT